MATQWTRERRQELFDVIANATFPLGEEAKQWKASNRTKDTRNNEEFHQITIRVQDKASAWFRNLKLM